MLSLPDLVGYCHSFAAGNTLGAFCRRASCGLVSKEGFDYATEKQSFTP
jgi:hypothetical protein